jgi:hypothetical protein
VRERTSPQFGGGGTTLPGAVFRSSPEPPPPHHGEGWFTNCRNGRETVYTLSPACSRSFTKDAGASVPRLASPQRDHSVAPRGAMCSAGSGFASGSARHLNLLPAVGPIALGSPSRLRRRNSASSLLKRPSSRFAAPSRWLGQVGDPRLAADGTVPHHLERRKLPGMARRREVTVNTMRWCDEGSLSSSTAAVYGRLRSGDPGRAVQDRPERSLPTRWQPEPAPLG